MFPLHYSDILEEHPEKCVGCRSSLLAWLPYSSSKCNPPQSAEAYYRFVNVILHRRKEAEMQLRVHSPDQGVVYSPPSLN